ncbi:MAG: hypothetical protein U0795_07695 [Pirellulales bacterium]
MMRSKFGSILGTIAMFIATAAPVRSRVTGAEIGFVEHYVLGTDRADALRQLVPGTEEYYYFHALHYQVTGQLDQVQPLLDAWALRLGQTPRWALIDRRQRLLSYDQHSQQTLDYLRDQLGLRFDHAPPGAEADPGLPTSVDQERLSREVLRQQAARQVNLQGFEDSALWWLVEGPLTPDQRRELLQRWRGPIHPRLLDVLAEDLRDPQSPRFGGYPVHQQLLLDHLDRLAGQFPELLSNDTFVRGYLQRLKPGPDEDTTADLAARQRHLDRMQAFAARLPATYLSLRANLLFHQLVLDRQRGQVTAERLLEYLRLPRSIGYVNPTWIQRPENRQMADLSTDYSDVTLLPPIGNDEPLVRSLLLEVLAHSPDANAFAPYLHEDYLRNVQAEAKLVSGATPTEPWAAMLSPEQFQALRDRVDLDFAPENTTYFQAEDPVRFDVWVKNVPTLLVRIYRLNAAKIFQTTSSPINTDINLDGLTPGHELKFEYPDPAMARVRRTFELPQLSAPGTYVVDFIGGGRSSRALIRKGRLTFTDTPTSAGHVIRVYDERGQLQPQAAARLRGREFTTDADGNLVIPFTQEPGPQPMVLVAGQQASLVTLNHLGESYELRITTLVDREQLLQHRTAKLLLGAHLLLNGQRASHEMLQEPTAEIITTDVDGIVATKVVRDLQLSDDRETEISLPVPPRTVSLRIRLTAKVKNLTHRRDDSLSAEQQFEYSRIDRTSQIEAFYLVRSGGNYQLQVLGRSGEPQPQRAVEVRLKPRDFRQEVTLRLQTDATGSVGLGPLTEVSVVTAQSALAAAQSWPIIGDRMTNHPIVHATAASPWAVPYLGGATEMTADEFSLVELRDGLPATDHTHSLKLIGRIVTCDGLPPGDYRLTVRSTGHETLVRIAAGKVDENWIVGARRYLELDEERPLQIQQLRIDGDQLSVDLFGATPQTRVIVVATRYEPGFAHFPQLASPPAPGLTGVTFPQLPSSMTTGRDIGDEYRYILQRQLAKRWPGNMLPRPELLLNPWELQATQTGAQAAKPGESPLATPAPASDAAEKSKLFGSDQAQAAGDFPNLDFLANSSRIVANVVADADGKVRIPLGQFADRQDLHVLAVSSTQTVYRRISAVAPQLQTLDLRLAQPINPQRHVALFHQSRVMMAGETLTMPAGRSARWAVYDQLSKVHQLLLGSVQHPDLAKFEFLTRWSELAPADKQRFYDLYACHELHYFLYRKDRPFFDEVVRPFLANKLEPTFTDRWLLQNSNDIDRGLPILGQLNTWEQILRAQGQSGELEPLRRRLRELWSMRPPRPTEEMQLFELAIRGLQSDDDASRLGREQAGTSLYYAAPLSAGDANVHWDREEESLGLTDGSSMRWSALSGERGGAASSDRGRNRGVAVDEWSDKQSIAKLEDSTLGARAGRRAGLARKYRAKAEVFYAPLESTKEYAESNFYRVARTTQSPDLVPLDPYWLAFADHNPADQFISPRFLEPRQSLNAILLMLATLDLPSKSAEHAVKLDGDQLALTAASPLVVFYEELRDSEPPASPTGVLVSQHIYQSDDRTEVRDGRPAEKYVTGELVVDRVYGCKVVVTNTTSLPRTLHLLLQVPGGSIGLNGQRQIESVPVQLDAYESESIEYEFYFPEAGQFEHFPVHVRSDQRLVAFAPAQPLTVVARPSEEQWESWAYVAQFATDQQVLDFIARRNVFELDLDRIAFRLANRAFYDALVGALAERQVFHPTVWSYAVRHADVPRIREFLRQKPEFVASCGPRLESPLLAFGAVEAGLYEHLEYKPLVNARAHQLGARREILNDRFHAQYHRWLEVLSYQPKLSDDDRLATVYYLLLQDRIDEAIAVGDAIAGDQLDSRLQYDYLTAYLDFYREDLAHARAIAQRYAAYPVDHWRAAFAEMTRQLDEIEGLAATTTSPNSESGSRNPNQPFPSTSELASQEPALSLSLDGNTAMIDAHNLRQVQVNYYLIDVEQLFSRQPFAVLDQQQRTGLAIVEPNRTQTVEIQPTQTRYSIPLPTELAGRHVYVEVTGGGKSAGQLAFASSLQVLISDRFGLLAVRDQASGRPLAKTYVKVYGQSQDGTVEFYKDGYTDLRGRFDYLSLSTDQLTRTRKLAILILSDTQGAVVREVQRP